MDRFLSNSEEYASFTSELANDVKVLWKDNGIQNTFAQSSKFQLIDSAQ